MARVVSDSWAFLFLSSTILFSWRCWCTLLSFMCYSVRQYCALLAGSSAVRVGCSATVCEIHQTTTTTTTTTTNTTSTTTAAIIIIISSSSSSSRRSCLMKPIRAGRARDTMATASRVIRQRHIPWRQIRHRVAPVSQLMR